MDAGNEKRDESLESAIERVQLDFDNAEGEVSDLYRMDASQDDIAEAELKRDNLGDDLAELYRRQHERDQAELASGTRQEREQARTRELMAQTQGGAPSSDDRGLGR